MNLRTIRCSALAFVTMMLFLGGRFASAQPGQQTPPAPKIGDAAPAIKVARLLQAPDGAATDLASLKGKVIVLEFWATWCAPCMPGIDHLNELAAMFKDQPVVFIAMTDEEEATINRFIKGKPIRGWIGIDPTLSVFHRFGVESRPHTTIIDRDGKIAAITMPSDLTAAAIEDLLAGKRIVLPLKPPSVEDDLQWDQHWYTDGRDPLFQFIIKPVPPTGVTVSKVGPEHYVAESLYLINILEWAYEMPQQRIEMRLPKSTQQYRASFWVPKGREDILRPMAQQAIEVGLSLKTHHEPREMEALVLTLPKGQPPKLHPSAATQPLAQVQHGLLVGRKQPMAALIKQLAEFNLSPGRIPVDETHLTETYDWDLPYDRASDRVILEAMREQLGLETVKEKRMVDVLVIEAIHPAR